jgi:hypothetical protein
VVTCWVAEKWLQLSKRDDWGFPKPADKAAAVAAAAVSSDEDASNSDNSGDNDDDIPQNPNARNALRCR